MDLQSRARWEMYTEAKEHILEKTHTHNSPWWIIGGNDKKKAAIKSVHCYLKSHIKRLSVLEFLA
jgi:polyphosphate kinase 2 (PPK2 family)